MVFSLGSPRIIFSGALSSCRPVEQPGIGQTLCHFSLADMGSPGLVPEMLRQQLRLPKPLLPHATSRATFSAPPSPSTLLHHPFLCLYTRPRPALSTPGRCCTHVPHPAAPFAPAARPMVLHCATTCISGAAALHQAPPSPHPAATPAMGGGPWDLSCQGPAGTPQGWEQHWWGLLYQLAELDTCPKPGWHLVDISASPCFATPRASLSKPTERPKPASFAASGCPGTHRHLLSQVPKVIRWEGWGTTICLKTGRSCREVCLCCRDFSRGFSLQPAWIQGTHCARASLRALSC